MHTDFEDNYDQSLLITPGKLPSIHRNYDIVSETRSIIGLEPRSVRSIYNSKILEYEKKRNQIYKNNSSNMGSVLSGGSDVQMSHNERAQMLEMKLDKINHVIQNI